MTEQELINLLREFKSGRIDEQSVLETVRNMPYADIGFAKIDHHRSLRRGFAEVIYCAGKSIAQSMAIIGEMAKQRRNILATRCDKELFDVVSQSLPQAVWHEAARAITVQFTAPETDDSRYILVLTAGTSDIPVAEETVVTAEIMGNSVKRCYDVGVAGIHRLFAQKDLIDNANVIVVIAGMDGALASVVGGLTSKPVIAVPTSIGYGANFAGLAALLSMLNTCASGVAVMNIDNGFGAGRLASAINHMR